jgi:hypothetical protein
MKQTKEQFFTDLSALNTKGLHIDFTSIDSVPCWNLNHSTDLSIDFILLFRGFIPLALTNKFPNCIKKQDALAALYSSITAARLTFKEHIWQPRCDHFIKFEESHGITSSNKRSPCTIQNHRRTIPKTRKPSHLCDNWKSWIDNSIRNGSKDWLGFLESINSKSRFLLTNACIYLFGFVYLA